jgi:hypothetical protein
LHPLEIVMGVRHPLQSTSVLHERTHSLPSLANTSKDKHSCMPCGFDSLALPRPPHTHHHVPSLHDELCIFDHSSQSAVDC